MNCEDNRQNMISELMKSHICASINEAERMADGIISTERVANDDQKEMSEEIVEQKNTSKVFITRQEFDSYLKINNKIVEANFVKLKNYTDSLIKNFEDEIRSLKGQLGSSPVQKKLDEHPANSTENFEQEDVSIEKMFYCGTK